MNVDAVSSAVRSAALSAGPVAGRPPGNKSGGPPYPVEVRGICKKYFAPENQSIVVVGDKAQVGEQLKAFGEFTSSDK